MTVDERSPDVDLLASVAPRHWAPIVFGVVPQGANRRRPSDVVRVFTAGLIVVLCGIGAHNVAKLEARVFDLIAALPDWTQEFAEFWFKVGTFGAVAAVMLALLLTRQFRLVLVLAIAGVLGYLASVGVRALVDVTGERSAAGLVLDGTVPKHPVVTLAVATTVLLVAVPYLLRPARRLVFLALWVGALGALFGVVGLVDDVVASVALGWGVAAALHLVIGTPAATPTLRQVANDLLALGVTVTDLDLGAQQVWGESRFVARAPDGGAISIEVIGRDATDARLFAKVGRSLWYKDSGPSVALTRSQQLEHRAYLLLLADRAGVPVSEVVIAGVAGPRDNALLVIREAEGTPLDQVDPAAVTDAVLDNAWQNLALLHHERVAHGSMGTANIRLRADGTTAMVNFALASSAAPPERCRLDAVELLVTTAAIAGDERALAAAQRSLGRDGVAELLPMLEPQALSAPTRHDLVGLKPLLKGLREQGAALTGEETVTLTELRRVSPTTILMAAGAILGVYLLIGELTQVDYKEVLNTAQWGWVAVAFLLSPLPQFSGSIAMMGSVGIALPFKAVLGEQFANNFTGLVGGTVATTALVIRFFQKQGQKIAVAASSGVLNSLAGMMVQTVVVVVGLIITGDEFIPSSAGGHRDIAGFVIALIIVGGIAIALALVVPKLRRRLRGMIAPQWNAGKENLRLILSTPRKAVMLFGGNLASQIIYALVLDASLHAYGESLPVLQLMVINSLASVLGGMAPVPGGMGVVEAGMIAGLTAAGIPEAQAVAATFTHRLFTAYLPPIWGWFSLQWLRRNDYV